MGAVGMGEWTSTLLMATVAVARLLAGSWRGRPRRLATAIRPSVLAGDLGDVVVALRTREARETSAGAITAEVQATLPAKPHHGSVFTAKGTDECCHFRSPLGSVGSSVVQLAARRVS